VPLKTTWLVSQLHASQDKYGSQADFMPLKANKRSQTQWLVSRLCASQDNNGSQANFTPLKTNKRSQTQWLASPTSVPLSQPEHHRIHPVYSGEYYQLYSTSVCVLGIPVCILPVTITKPETCAGFLPMPHRFSEIPSSFPGPPLSRFSWLLPDPGSFAFPSLARFLALADPLVLWSWSWVVRLTSGGAEEEEEEGREGGWSKRLTAGGAGGAEERGEEGRRCGLRLPGALC
jgi:hypothetical protein